MPQLPQTTLQMRLNQGFVNKMQCCWGNKLPDPFDAAIPDAIFLASFSIGLPQVINVRLFNGYKVRPVSFWSGAVGT